MRYFAHIGYRGTRYFGWQRQASQISVQEVIETSFARIFRKEIKIHGCGRTDTGVHATQFFFHFDFEDVWDFDLIFRLNKVLPNDISIFDIFSVHDLSHARFTASQREYDYYIHTYKDPFLSEYSSMYPGRQFDLAEMAKAVALLPNYNDYRPFCKSPDKHEHTICNVSAAKLYTNRSGNRVRLNISSNRYLTRMIRILVRKLLEIGYGELSVKEFENHLVNKKTPASILPAHPQGLYLSKISYPFIEVPVKTEFLQIQSAAEYWQLVGCD